MSETDSIKGDRRVSESIWNVDSLKELMDERDRRYMEVSAASERALTAALTAVREATSEAKHNTDKWQESANEWRNAMNDKDRNFVTERAMWGYFIGAIGLVLAIVEILQHTVR
jgi:hypothetical protein